ncbi:hypothetical protein KW785_00645 [Candidatus Parcubacteria bacterium]|nr:hypothetical protein [Candidatus Parcubacteria bacterium]
MQYRRTYWSQVASPWVSMSVLIGGMVSAILLYGLVRFDNMAENNSLYNYSTLN